MVLVNGEIPQSVRQQSCGQEQVPGVGRTCKKCGGRGEMRWLQPKPRSGVYSVSVKVIRGTQGAMRYLQGVMRYSMKQQECNRNYT